MHTLDLRNAAVLLLGLGASGSAGLTLYATRNSPPVLMVLFVGWVLLPFVLLAVLWMRSYAWSRITWMALRALIFTTALGSLLIYAVAAFRPAGTRRAPPFVMTPVVFVALTLIVIPAAALIARRRSH